MRLENVGVVVETVRPLLSVERRRLGPMFVIVNDGVESDARLAVLADRVVAETDVSEILPPEIVGVCIAVS